MKTNLQSIALKAIALLLVSAATCYWLAGAAFALGFVLSSLLMLGSLGYGWWVTRPMIDGAIPSAKIPILVTLKFPVVGLAAWVLLTKFPPLSVALGGTILVAAITADAILSSLKAPTAARKA